MNHPVVMDFLGVTLLGAIPAQGSGTWSPNLVFFILAGFLLGAAAYAAPLSRWLQRRGGSMVLVGAIGGAWLGLGAIGVLVFRLLDLDFEQHAAWMWSAVCFVSLGTGMLVAKRCRRVAGMELCLAMFVVLDIAALLLQVFGDDPGLSDPPVRALLVAPAVIALASYFGASVGYLLWGEGGQADVGLGYEAQVGRRFLLSKSSSVLSTVTTISVVGVALGVWLVIVALAVLSGFEFDLQRKIIGANAHVVVQRNEGRTFSLPEGLIETIEGVEGVVAASPFLQGEVALASTHNFTGGLLFGIDPVRSPAVLSVLREDLQVGSLEPLVNETTDAAPAHEVDDIDFAPPAPLPNLIVGVEMRKSLNLRPGDRVTVLSPILEELTPLGPVPASRPFVMAGAFSSAMYEFDARFAYASLESVREFFDVGPQAVSGIQVRVANPDFADRVGATIARTLGDAPCPEGAAVESACGWRAIDWKTRNQTLFAALKLERVVAFVVLVFIILVASFSIVNTLTMSVIEKQKEIAILKTMGARDVGIMKLFLVQGMLVGVFGTLLGAAFAVFTVFMLQTFGFWIPGAVYYIDSLPVHLEAMDVVLVVLAALLIVWDFAVFPALRGSQLEPVEGLRDG